MAYGRNEFFHYHVKLLGMSLVSRGFWQEHLETSLASKETGMEMTSLKVNMVKEKLIFTISAFGSFFNSCKLPGPWLGTN